MRLKFLAVTSALAGALGVTPGHAALQIAVSTGGANFFCADNSACDLNPLTGILSVGDQTIGGVLVNGSIQESVHNGIDSLNTSSLSIVNTTGSAVSAAAAIGDTDFVGPVSRIEFAGAGTWEGAVGSTITLQWFADAANGQGADSASDAPGVLVGSFFNAPALLADSFSTEGSSDLALAGPFSMTELTSGELSPGASLINRGQAELGAVPEPGTWALLCLGFAGLGFAARRRIRQAHCG